MLHDQSQRADCLEVWKTVEAQFDDVPLMCSRLDFNLDRVLLAILSPTLLSLSRRKTSPVEFASLTEGVEQFDGPLSVKTLHLGTAGEPAADSVCVEYNSLLVPPDQPEFMQGTDGTTYRKKTGIRLDLMALPATSWNLEPLSS